MAPQLTSLASPPGCACSLWLELPIQAPGCRTPYAAARAASCYACRAQCREASEIMGPGQVICDCSTQAKAAGGTAFPRVAADVNDDGLAFDAVRVPGSRMAYDDRILGLCATCIRVPINPRACGLSHTQCAARLLVASPIADTTHYAGGGFNVATHAERCRERRRPPLL